MSTSAEPPRRPRPSPPAGRRHLAWGEPVPRSSRADHRFGCRGRARWRSASVSGSTSSAGAPPRGLGRGRLPPGRHGPGRPRRRPGAVRHDGVGGQARMAELTQGSARGADQQVGLNCGRASGCSAKVRHRAGRQSRRGRRPVGRVRRRRVRRVHPVRLAPRRGGRPGGRGGPAEVRRRRSLVAVSGPSGS